jgi:hypothetical protein
MEGWTTASLAKLAMLSYEVSLTDETSRYAACWTSSPLCIARMWRVAGCSNPESCLYPCSVSLPLEHWHSGNLGVLNFVQKMEIFNNYAKFRAFKKCPSGVYPCFTDPNAHKYVNLGS